MIKFCSPAEVAHLPDVDKNVNLTGIVLVQACEESQGENYKQDFIRLVEKEMYIKSSDLRDYVDRNTIVRRILETEAGANLRCLPSSQQILEPSSPVPQPNTKSPGHLKIHYVNDLTDDGDGK
jgi:hypothetical protein